jgi:ABC-type amino acid transport substrate-binding protein
MYILGKQIKYESLLYGRVDFIVTDSPVILSAFYENLYETGDIVLDAATGFMKKAEQNGIKYKNFWLPSHDNYDERGRYQSKDEVDVLGPQMRRWLDDIKLNVDVVDVELEDRVAYILKSL